MANKQHRYSFLTFVIAQWTYANIKLWHLFKRSDSFFYSKQWPNLSSVFNSRKLQFWNQHDMSFDGPRTSRNYPSWLLLLSYSTVFYLFLCWFLWIFVSFVFFLRMTSNTHEPFYTDEQTGSSSASLSFSSADICNGCDISWNWWKFSKQKHQ